MMVDHYNIMDMRYIALPISQPNLRTGVGRGHCRGFSRERPEKNAQAKRRKRTKMRKTSRRRNWGN